LSSRHGICFRPLEPSYHAHRYIDRDREREDVIEVLSPELLPWLANYIYLGHEQTSYLSAAGLFYNMTTQLRAQARHNLSRLRAYNAQYILKCALLALLALHLQRPIGKLRILAKFSFEPDGCVVLKTLSAMSKSTELLHLVQDDSFQFDLHFADAYPSSWFPRGREPVATPQRLDAAPDSGESHESSVGFQKTHPCLIKQPSLSIPSQPPQNPQVVHIYFKGVNAVTLYTNKPQPGLHI
jgi:hypothetical protein